MLQKLRNLSRFLIPYLVITYKPVTNCEAKRKGSLLACKIQDSFIPECIGMKLIHHILTVAKLLGLKLLVKRTVPGLHNNINLLTMKLVISIYDSWKLQFYLEISSYRVANGT